VSGIYLIRHGETEWNAAGRFQGALDSRLTPRGLDQAARIGRCLARIFRDQAIELKVSPLGRTRQTAEIVARHLSGASLITEPRLCEVSLGEWDGLTFDEINAGWPDGLDGTTSFDWYFRAPGGESLDAAIARAAAWLGSLKHPVIAVSHGLFGRLIRGVYARLDTETMLGMPISQNVIWHLHERALQPISV
jgi:broad specificity phosphatase PhoE